MITFAYPDKLKPELLKYPHKYMILQSVVRVMAGKMPAADEQSSKTQAGNQRVYGFMGCSMSSTLIRVHALTSG